MRTWNMTPLRLLRFVEGRIRGTKRRAPASLVEVEITTEYVASSCNGNHYRDRIVIVLDRTQSTKRPPIRESREVHR